MDRYYNGNNSTPPPALPTYDTGETLAVGVVGAAGPGGREDEIRVVVLQRHRSSEVAATSGAEVEDLVLHTAGLAVEARVGRRDGTGEREGMTRGRK